MSKTRGGDAVYAMIANGAGVYTPTGQPVTHGPIESVEGLGALLDYVRKSDRLTALGVPPQLWLVGNTVCERLGFHLDYDDPQVADRLDATDSDEEARVAVKEMLSQRVSAALRNSFADGENEGWILGRDGDFDGGALVPLRYVTRGRSPFRVHLMIEPYMWTLTRHGDLGVLGNDAGGAPLPPDDEVAASREIGRRLQWMSTKVGVLPGVSSASTGATLLDSIYRERRRTGRGAVVDQPTPMPAELPDHYQVEPEMLWCRDATEEEIDGADELLTVDQRASYLASASTLELGWGTPAHVGGEEAVEIAMADNIPFALWRVMLPAGDEVGCDPRLPMPVPRMSARQAVDTWITTESLLTLNDSVADGGAGIDLADLDIQEAYIYPERGRILEAWAKRLREARKDAVAEDDPTLKALVGAIYKGYVGRISNPDYWQSSWKAHHLQPMWRSAIIAGARRRGRRHAARIGQQFGVWPIAGHTDSWTYLVPSGMDLADESGYLGRLAEERRVKIDDEMRETLRAGQLSLHVVESMSKPAAT